MRYSKLRYCVSRILGYVCTVSLGVSAAILVGNGVDVSAITNVVLGHILQVAFGIGSGVLVGFGIWIFAIWIFLDSLWY